MLPLCLAIAVLLVLALPRASGSKMKAEQQHPCYYKGLTGTEYARRRWLIGGFQLLYRGECPTEDDHRLSKFVGEFWTTSPFEDAKFCQELFRQALKEGTSPITLRRVLEVHRHGLTSINAGFEAYIRELSLGTMFKILSGGFYHKVEQYIKWLTERGTHNEYLEMVKRNKGYLERYINQQWILTNPDPCFLALALYDLERPIEVHLVHTRHKINLMSEVHLDEGDTDMSELAEDVDLRHGLLRDATELLKVEWDPSELEEPFSMMELDESLAWDDIRGDFVREQSQAVHAYLLGELLEEKVPWRHIGKFFTDYATYGGGGDGDLSLPQDELLFLGHAVMEHVRRIKSNQNSTIHPQKNPIPARSLRALFDLLSSLPQLDSYQQQVRFALQLDERLGLFILAEVYLEMGDYARALRAAEDFQEQERVRWALAKSERDILNAGDGQWVSLWRTLSGLLAGKRLILTGQNGEARKVLETTFARLINLHGELSRSGSRGAEPLLTRTQAILRRLDLVRIGDKGEISDLRPLIHHPSTWAGRLWDELAKRQGALRQSSLLQGYFLNERELKELELEPEERSQRLHERLGTLCRDAAAHREGGARQSCFEGLQETILETAKLLLTPKGGLLWRQVQETYGLLFLAKQVRNATEERTRKPQMTLQREADSLTRRMTMLFLTRRELQGEIPEGRQAKVAQERLEYMCKGSQSSGPSCYERLQSSIITMAEEHSEPVEGLSIVNLAQRLGLVTLLDRTRNHLNVSQQAMAICLGLPSRQQLRGRTNEALILAEERATERGRLIATLDKAFGEQGRRGNFLHILLHLSRATGSGSGRPAWPVASPPRRLLESLEREREVERASREREHREELLQMRKLQTEAQLREEEARRALGSMQGRLEILLNNQKSGAETTIKELQMQLEVSEGQHNALISWLRVHLHTDDFIQELGEIESALGGVVSSQRRLSELVRSLREDRNLMYKALGGGEEGGAGGDDGDRRGNIEALLGRIIRSLLGTTRKTKKAVDLSITVPEAIKAFKARRDRELRVVQERSEKARHELLLRHGKINDTLQAVQSYFYGERGPFHPTQIGSGGGGGGDDTSGGGSDEREGEQLLKRISRLCDRPTNCLAQLEATTMHISKALQMTGERHTTDILSSLKEIHRVAEQTQHQLVGTMEEKAKDELELQKMSEALKRAQDTEVALERDLSQTREQVREKTLLGERLEHIRQQLGGRLLLLSQEVHRQHLRLISTSPSWTPIRQEALATFLLREVQLEQVRVQVAAQPGDDILECLGGRMRLLRDLERSSATKEQVQQVRKMESILGEEYTLEDLEEQVADLQMAERGNNLMDILRGYQHLLKRGFGSRNLSPSNCQCSASQRGMMPPYLGMPPHSTPFSASSLTTAGGYASPSSQSQGRGQGLEGEHGEISSSPSLLTSSPASPLEKDFARAAILAQSIGKMARSVRHQLSLEEIVRDFEASKFDLAQRYADAQATVGSLRDENAMLTERIETFLQSTTNEALQKLNTELQLRDREKQQYLKEALRAETRYTQLMDDLRSSLGVKTMEDVQLEFFSVYEVIRRLFQEDDPGPLNGSRLSERLLALHFETTRLRAQCPAVGLTTMDRESMIKRVERAVEASREIERRGQIAGSIPLKGLEIRAQASVRTTASSPTAPTPTANTTDGPHLSLACQGLVSRWRAELQRDQPSVLPVKCVSSIPPEELAAMDKKALAWVPVEGLEPSQFWALPPEKLDWLQWSSLSSQSDVCHALRTLLRPFRAPNERVCSQIRIVCNLDTITCQE